jgi:beta-ribofuranosylaminobenzene 5'-phosphate synthase
MVQEPNAVLTAQFGEVGLLDFRIEASEYWSHRIRTICQHWLDVHQFRHLPVRQMTCDRTVCSHVGLGSGTQVACAVVALLELACGHELPDLARLTSLSLRGARSFVGLSGFLQGGLIVDYGLNSERMERVSRHSFPEEWPILLIRTTVDVGDSGDNEKRMFALCSQVPNPNRSSMLQIVAENLVPAVLSKDWQAWDTYVGIYGQMAGNIFAPAQGGVYRFPMIAEMVSFLQRLGCQGAAQSSWGPTVMLVCRDQDHAHWITSQLANQFSHVVTEQSFACNHPARWSQA